MRSLARRALLAVIGCYERQNSSRLSLGTMPDFPTGTVTFLFTDVEGSTKLLQQIGDRYREVLANYRRILRSSIDAGTGVVVDLEGDSVFAVFPSAADAVIAAIEAQRALASQAWPEGAELRVRMGVHTGEATLGPEGYVGLDVHRAARIVSAAHGGQVVISASTLALVEHSLPEGVTVRDLGSHRLKDLADAEQIAQVVVPGLPNSFGPLRSLDVVRHDLPIQLTSFVGREQELAELDDLLSSARLVTLIGPGGSGKTRLALEGASHGIDRYRDGAWFVDLAPLTSPDQVPLAVAGHLGVSGQSGRPTEDVLVDYLADRELQLVLDNCEHLVDKVSQLVAGLLQAAPQLRVLATSREPLGVTGETTYEVQPLPFPGVEDGPNVEAFDAVRLFVERARSAEPRFELTDANARAVAQICRRLDGMPLALELAAARVRTFAPQQLAGLLDDRFALLTSPVRTAAARHQTLRAAVEWSYDLLADPARTLFGRLSVFRRGFDLKAAEHICGTDLLSATDVLTLLPELVDKSLVVADRRPDRETRYRLLETLREYGQERLDSTETEHVRDAHAAYFCSFAERAATHLRGPEQQSWIDQLAVDYDNLRKALRSAFSENPELGIRLATALADYWDAVGPRLEGQEWLRRAVELSQSAAPDLRMQARLAASNLFLSTHLSHSVQFAEEALEEARRIGDEASEARALGVLALARGLQEDHRQAMSLGEQALEISRRLGDQWETASCLMRLGQADYQDLDRSIQRFQESLALYREVGDRRRAAMVLYNMAERSARAGRELDAAAGWVRESLSIFQEMGSTNDSAHALLELGKILRRQGQPEEAREVLDTALELLRKVGDQRCTVRTLSALGIALTESGDRQRAHEALKESLQLGQMLGEEQIVRVTLVGMARLQASTGQKSEAATLYAAADKLGRELGIPVSETIAARRRKRVERLHTGMEPRAFDDAWTAGAAMTLDEAVAYALEKLGTQQVDPHISLKHRDY